MNFSNIYFLKLLYIYFPLHSIFQSVKINLFFFILTYLTTQPIFLVTHWFKYFYRINISITLFDRIFNPELFHINQRLSGFCHLLWK